MSKFLKMFFGQRMLGIDIGTDSIKVVEVSAFGRHRKLENYSEVKSSLVSKDPLLSVDEKGNLVSSNLISSALKDILKEARIKTKKAIFSLPDFLTFSVSFEIPPMPEKEIAGVVYYSASKYITMPVSEVTLDWMVISENSKNKNLPIKIFLMAVPNQVIKEYQQIAKTAGLDLLALNPEVFGIAKSLAGGNKKPICFVDIGNRTSTINVADNGHLKRSSSFNFGGEQLSRALLSLGIQKSEAETIKTEEGLLSKKENVAKIFKDFLGQLFYGIKDVSGGFYFQEKKQISEFYLTGGTANLPGLKEYFLDNFKGSSVFIPNCFTGFSYPKILSSKVSEMAPRFSVAVGVALEILEM